MTRWLIALFAPMCPPKNYSVADQDFESQYKKMRDQYLKQQFKPNQIYDTKFDMPLSFRTAR